MFDPLLTEAENIRRLFSINGGKALQKIFQRKIIGQVIEQRADGDTSPFEYRRATEDFRIAANEGLRSHTKGESITGKVGDEARSVTIVSSPASHRSREFRNPKPIDMAI